VPLDYPIKNTESRATSKASQKKSKSSYKEGKKRAEKKEILLKNPQSK